MIKPKPIRGQVAALLAKGVKQSQIAQALSVSKSTVTRIAAEVRPDIDSADSILKDMQRTILKILPNHSRVQTMKRLLTVAEDTKQPSSGLSILQYADKLLGVIPDGDRLKYATSDENARNGAVPMFSLPPASFINVTVNQTVNNSTPTDSGQASLHNTPSVTHDLQLVDNTEVTVQGNDYAGAGWKPPAPPPKTPGSSE